MNAGKLLAALTVVLGEELLASKASGYPGPLSDRLARVYDELPAEAQERVKALVGDPGVAPKPETVSRGHSAQPYADSYLAAVKRTQENDATARRQPR